MINICRLQLSIDICGATLVVVLEQVVPIWKELVLDPVHVVGQVWEVGGRQGLLDGCEFGDGQEPEGNTVNLGYLK
jgi:hypothetical protein